MNGKGMYLLSQQVPNEIIQPLYMQLRDQLQEPKPYCVDEYRGVMQFEHLRTLHLLTAGVDRFKEAKKLFVTKSFLRSCDYDWNIFNIVVGVVLNGNGVVKKGNDKDAGDVRPGTVWVRLTDHTFGLESTDDQPFVYLELLMTTTSPLRIVQSQVEYNLLALLASKA